MPYFASDVLLCASMTAGKNREGVLGFSTFPRTVQKVAVMRRQGRQVTYNLREEETVP